MQGPFWEANRFLLSQEIPLVLWNPKAYFRFYKCLHLSLPWVSSIHFMLYPRFSKWSTSLRLPHQNTVCTQIYSTCPARFILLDLISLTIFGKEQKSYSSPLYSLFHSHITSSVLGSEDIFLRPKLIITGALFCTVLKWHTWQPRRKWEGNIKMNVKEIKCEGLYWIQVAQQTRLLGFIENSWVHSLSYYQLLIRDYKPYRQ